MKDLAVGLASVFTSYFVGKTMGTYRTSTDAFANISMGAIRRVVLLMTVAAIAVCVMIGGFFTVLVDLVLATRTQGALALTQASIVGFVLMLVSALSLGFYVFKNSSWKAELVAPKPQPSPIVEALAELVRDFTEERRLRREYGEPPSQSVDEIVATARGAQRPGTPLHM